MNPDAIDQRARFLLAVRRPLEALAIVKEAIATAPDEASLHSLRAECHLAANQTVRAEQAITVAFACGPPSAHTLGVATRVALASGAARRAAGLTQGSMSLALERAALLRQSAPLEAYTWYLSALIYAYVRDYDACDAAIAHCKLLNGAEPLGRTTAIDCALIIGGQDRLRNAQRDVGVLMEQFPAEGKYRRAAALIVRRQNRPFGRSASVELRHLVDAAGLGSYPLPGELSSTFRRAVSPVMLTVGWAGVMIAMYIQNFNPAPDWTRPAVFLLTGVWIALIVLFARRSARSTALLPSAGRRRIALPTTRVYVVLGLICVGLSTLSFVRLSPFDRARAIELELGRPPGTEKVRIQLPSVTIPRPSFPTFPTFPNIPTLPTFPPVSTIPASPTFASFPTFPTFPTQTSSPQTLPPIVVPGSYVTVDAAFPLDEDRAYAIMRRLIVQTWATVAVGSTLMAAGLWLRRSATRP